ncbi:MAG: HAD family hydrolase [Gammaproteobacteria bacterium]|nr:MAG: HAD family hydrolase [Gammaproteobacteria bacterium]
MALFDLDNTLIGGDSDVLWGDFLAEHGYVDGRAYRREHERYYRDYLEGTLDIHDFLRFQLRILTTRPLDELAKWREQFIEEKIRPLLLPAARELIEHHRSQGDRLLVITATNRFITEPIVKLLGISELIASEPEMVDGRYTGEVAGVPSYAQGKVIRLRQWLRENGGDLERSWFYSDSHNDLPLLELVEHPVAVDPDEVLAAEARRRGWPIMSLR